MKAEWVDVFSKRKLEGNGLTIFYDCEELSTEEMLALTREMRQYESIFLFKKEVGFRARIFTMEEELDFAGHPLLGLALHLHEHYGNADAEEWKVQLNSKCVELISRRRGRSYKVEMNQGRPIFSHKISKEAAQFFYRALSVEEFIPKIAPEVVSTGLPYLILPVRGGLDQAHYTTDISSMLSSLGARFLYLLDMDHFEARSWDNRGFSEDVATGSAAGPAAAFLFKNGLTSDRFLHIRQGRFLGRPSIIGVRLEGEGLSIEEVRIHGDVVKVADLEFDV